MDVVWHPIKERDSLKDYMQYWATIQWPGGLLEVRLCWIGKGGWCWNFGDHVYVVGEASSTGPRIIAWADYTPPAPYEGEA